ncbi:unnamed protein product (mitochondrion) [Plasmodiophora brassicae]|uniref:Uncharacterized protein n=1 Tax=Plasmodiophora brassicae TaxID=37360 RepID=A0A0G4J0M0_PLABS|nr:hypothetical protein PBRA_008394 [Plasmodiophora brassicae]SPR01242.1 unnamed protein product [Plasmodiophora brassicae]
MLRLRSNVAASKRAALAVRALSTGKDLKFGNEARQTMLKGVDMVADAVQTTLGPKGRNVVIDESFRSPKITKDGVTVAKAITFADKQLNLGAQLVKSVAQKTNDVAGDGTTTATVLARAILSEGIKGVASGMNPMDLRRGINLAVAHVVDNLKAAAKQIATKEEISQVATISANGDKDIGEMIATAMERVGKEGVITVQEGKTMIDELDVVEGMRFDRGFISPYFITESKQPKCILENPLVLLFDKKISSIQKILPVFESAVKMQRPLLVIAEDVDGEALATMILNKLRGNVKIAAVKAPGFGDNRKATMKDLAILLGTEVISEETGEKLEEVTVDRLGSAKVVTITKDDTIILDGAGSKEAIAARCEEIRTELAESTTKYVTEKLESRLAKLASGVAVVKVGGASEVEVGERKDRIDDALNATRAAVEEGIVPGGGVALLYAAQGLDKLPAANVDQSHGVKIIAAALKVPCKAICNNAGLEGAVVVGNLLNESNGNTQSTKGMNASTGEYVDMLKAGIIDPVKVVRTALADAASVASMMTTSEVIITDVPAKEEPAGGRGAGMRGGMGDEMF